MFGDYVKMGVKAAALIAGVALIVVLFTSVQIPSLDISVAYPYLRFTKAVLVHYIPGFTILWTLAMAWLSFELSVLLVKFSLIAIKWILKVAE